MLRAAIFLGLVLALFLPGGMARADFMPVLRRDAFVTIIEGRDLTRFGLRLTVSSDGEIGGRAFGQSVRGSWTWRDRYFCRTLVFGRQDLGDDCQAVSVQGNVLRFVADEGRGDRADLRLE